MLKSILRSLGLKIENENQAPVMTRPQIENNRESLGAESTGGGGISIGTTRPILCAAPSWAKVRNVHLGNDNVENPETLIRCRRASTARRKTAAR